MSKEADLIQIYNDEKRELEYFVKGFNITKSIKILLKAHKEEYDTERRIFAEFKGFNDAEKEFRQTTSDLEAKLAESEKRLVNCVDFDIWQKTAKENNELKHQLAEKDKTIENWQTMYQSVMQSCHNGIEEDKRLREQLAEKEHSIEMLNQHITDKAIEIERLGEELEELKTENMNIFEYSKEVEQQLAEKDKELLEIKQRIAEKASKEFQEMIDKRENHNQDKISFAVEQLEKVKEFCNQREKDFTYLRDEIKAISHNKWVDYIEELRFIKAHIDNQIEELKKEMK